MPRLLSLSFRAVDLATRPSRWALGKLLERTRSEEHDAPPTPAATAPQTAPREPEAVRFEPTHGEVAAHRQALREEEWGDGDGPGAEITIDPAVLELREQTPQP